MANKKRLIRVEVTLRHQRDYGPDHRLLPDEVETIDILPGQTFVPEIGFYVIKENGNRVRTINYKAGCTVDIKYFYI